MSDAATYAEALFEAAEAQTQQGAGIQLGAQPVQRPAQQAVLGLQVALGWRRGAHQGSNQLGSWRRLAFSSVLPLSAERMIRR